MKHKFYIVGEALIEKNPIKKDKIIKEFLEFTIEDPIEIIWNSLNITRELPEEEKGVYIIYDENGDCIYIGKTEQKQGFRGRMHEHKRENYYRYWSARTSVIRLYIMSNDDLAGKKRTDPLKVALFERVKLEQINPIFNRDDRSDSSKKVISNYKKETNIKQWEVVSEIISVVVPTITLTRPQLFRFVGIVGIETIKSELAKSNFLKWLKNKLKQKKFKN